MINTRKITLTGSLFIALVFIGSCKKNDPAVPPDGETNPAVSVQNVSNLTQWNAWKNNNTSRFDWVVLGDSYTQANYFTQKLRTKVLADGYTDGGPGYCSFNRWDASQLYTKDSSINPAELDFTYDPSQWGFEKLNTIGPCGYVTSNTANAAIHVTATEALSSITIIYERHANAGSFRYRINNGNWVTVSDVNSVSDIGNTVVDVSNAGASIALDIEPLNAGMEFCGVLAKKNGNVLVMDKCGSSGATAYMFATNDLWSESTQLLTPKGVIIEFGLNEIIGNVSPADMKVSMQNIINKVRTFSPNCDIIVMSPPETTYEKEDPRQYKLAEYTKMLYQLSVDNKAAFVDLAAAFGPFSQASVDSGLFNADRTHPGPKGSDLITSVLYSALKK